MDTQHQFNARESDWGFPSFMPLSELYDPARGYLVNDTIVVEADVAVHRVVDYWAHDSKKKTGYAVYHMPTTENDMPSGSITLALQSLFYKLQYSDTSVATKELTKSFGWDTYDSFMQHDVREFNRVLCEKLEDKMKGTVDLQLDVKGCRDVYASFDKYVEVDRLEGDNKYHAEQFGLQDARKGVLFIDFPPVLQLQLKRFEYDFMRDTMVKINDRYEFPLQLDLDRENGKYLSSEADRSVRNLYTLHSVLVHSGGVHGGHYYAYIRLALTDQWFKFDDERVTKEDIKRALEEQYGGEEELPQTNPGFNNSLFKFTKYSNAYILVYIRECDKEKIICNADEKDIAEPLRVEERIRKGTKEKGKSRSTSLYYHKVARDEDLLEQIGRDIYFDLVDHDKVQSFRIQKQMPFKLFKGGSCQRVWYTSAISTFLAVGKAPKSHIPSKSPVDTTRGNSIFGQLREVSNKASNAELKLFLEVELGQDLKPILPPLKSKEEILLFFKQYDPLKEELQLFFYVVSYVGWLFVKANGKPVEILTKLNELAGFAPDEEIELFEEIKFEPNVMCERMDKKLTFRGSQLEDGDIICFQKSQVESGKQCCCLYVPAFLEYVHNRQVVRFRSLEKPKENEFCLELSKLHDYDDVVKRVACHLGLDDPSKIRLTSQNCYSQQPKPQPIKYRGVEHLSDMLVHHNQTSDILYYEVLDIPLPELQNLKTLKVAFHHATKDEVVVIHTRTLPKQSTVGDVINDLKTKVKLSRPNAELRLLQTGYHKIYKIFPLNEKIENINDQYWTLRAEEIPKEEKNLGPHDCLIHVYHFMKVTAQNQVVQNFGKPFFLVIHEGEMLTEIKERIQKKLQVPDEEFSKWKFAFLSLGRLKYLQDLDIVSSRFQRRDVYGTWEQYLGLEHSDNTPKRSYVANQNRHSFEKPKPEPYPSNSLILFLGDTIIVETDIAVPSRDSKESGCQAESQHPSQDNNLGNVEVDTTAISGEEVSSVESVWQGLVLTEAPSVDKEAERVHSESTLYTSFSGTSPPQQAAQPILGNQGSSKATPVGATSTITQAGGHASSDRASDIARGCNIGKVRFLSWWVSSEASLLLKRIHGLHNDTFTRLSMKGHILQTMLLESFASFIESMSNTTVHDEEALRLAAISIEDFEQIGLDLSWLKQRLDEAKRVNKHMESLAFVDLCESTLKVARAKVRELEESLAKAKAEVEVWSRDLPKSLGVDDSVLKDVESEQIDGFGQVWSTSQSPLLRNLLLASVPCAKSVICGRVQLQSVLGPSTTGAWDENTNCLGCYTCHLYR
ncbi:unnamed protein product [Camellia sinensis]